MGGRRDLRFWITAVVGAACFFVLFVAADRVGGRLLARGVFIGALLVWALLRWRQQRR